MSILSPTCDAHGFYYGSASADDPRQINVRLEYGAAHGKRWRKWVAWVGNDKVPIKFNSKEEAEAAAVAIAKQTKKAGC
jgi:hypothetical protein